MALHTLLPPLSHLYFPLVFIIHLERQSFNCKNLKYSLTSDRIFKLLQQCFLRWGTRTHGAGLGRDAGHGNLKFAVWGAVWGRASSCMDQVDSGQLHFLQLPLSWPVQRGLIDVQPESLLVFWTWGLTFLTFFQSHLLNILFWAWPSLGSKGA